MDSGGKISRHDNISWLNMEIHDTPAFLSGGNGYVFISSIPKKVFFVMSSKNMMQASYFLEETWLCLYGKLFKKI